MCTLNDGRKLLLHWMFTDFVNVTELSNNNIITTMKNIMITNNNSDNSKFNCNSNNDTHTTTTTPATIQSYLNENMTDPNRLILRTTMTFLIQHNLQYIEQAMHQFYLEKFPLLIKSTPIIILSLEGGKVEDKHTDYPMETEEQKQVALYSRICCIVLSGTVSIKVYKSNGYNGNTIKVNTGDLFIGRGRLIHNNLPDDHDSLHMLWYLDKIGHQRENDKFYRHYKGLDPEKLDVHYSRCWKNFAEYRSKKKERQDANRMRMKALHENRLRRSNA